MDNIPQDGVLLRDIPAGGANVYIVRNDSGEWPSPPGENQYSRVGYTTTDTQGCVSYSAIHSLESQMIKLFGITNPNLSERFLAKMSGTTTNGNYVDKVYTTIQQCGLATDDIWPEPATFTWSDYYAEIPQDVKTKALDFLKDWTVTWRQIAAFDVPQALKEAPVIAIISAENPVHAVECITSMTYFDTYPPYLKTLGTVHSYFQLILNKKNPMPQIKTLNVKGEEGIFLAASSPEEFATLCKVFGKNPVQLDEVV